MEESDEELVAVESVKDSTESSKSQDPGGKGSSEEVIGRGAQGILDQPVASPVPTQDSESLKSAQSESLVEDLPKTLRPSAKALSGSSVKEVMSPNKGNKSEVKDRLSALEKMMGEALPMLVSLQDRIKTPPNSPLKDEDGVNSPVKGERDGLYDGSFPPLPGPPGPPPRPCGVWGSSATPSEAEYEPTPEMMAQWAKHYKELAKQVNAEPPFKGMTQEDDRQSVSWSQTGSVLAGQLDQMCKLEGCDTIVDKNVKFKQLDISDPHTRGQRFIMWQRDSRLKVRKLSKIALTFWDATVKVVETAYHAYLAAPQLEKASIHPDQLNDPAYSMTKDYVLDAVRSSLTQEISDYMLVKNVVELEELLFQLMIRAQPGSHEEIKKLLEFLERPVPVHPETNKHMFPLNYKSALTLLEKWDMVRNRLLELNQSLPNPLNAWPAVETIFERVLTLQEEFKHKVIEEKIRQDITDNPTYEKIERMRSMYAVFSNQHIDDPRNAHPGPRGHTGVKPAPKLDPKGKGKDKQSPQGPPAPHSQPRPTLSKLVVPVLRR